MEHGVGGATRRGDGSNGIFQGISGDDLLGPQVAFEQVNNQMSTLSRDRFLFGVQSRDAIKSHRRNAQKFKCNGHGVGRKLATA